MNTTACRPPLSPPPLVPLLLVFSSASCPTAIDQLIVLSEVERRRYQKKIIYTTGVAVVTQNVGVSAFEEITRRRQPVRSSHSVRISIHIDGHFDERATFSSIY